MSRQPYIQYVQFYQYSNTARKLDPQPRTGKTYELPSQQPKHQKAKKPAFGVLEVCSAVVCAFVLLSMVVGLLKVGVLASRQQELQGYIESPKEECADLQVAFDNAYDLEMVADRAGQMGLVDASQATHVTLPSAPVPSAAEESITWSDILGELFAKAPH